MQQDKHSKETLVAVVKKTIRKEIVSYQLPPGKKLNIKELAERYGVSETPVKIALNQLASEHIVENVPRHGIWVKPINLREAVEVFALRKMMDLYYTKEIIETVSASKNLDKLLQKSVDSHAAVMKRYLEDESSVEIYFENYVRDMEFHEIYLGCTGNKKLVELYKSINPFMYTNYIFRKQSQQRNLEGVQEHQKMVDAILAKDEAELRRVVTAHIDNAVRSINAVFKEKEILG